MSTKFLPTRIAYYVENLELTKEDFCADPQTQFSITGYEYTEAEMSSFWNMVLYHRAKQPREITEADCF